MNTLTRIGAAAGAAALLGAGAAMPAQAHDGHHHGGSGAGAGAAVAVHPGSTLGFAKVRELNGSDAWGVATVHLKGQKADVRLSAFGLVRNAPHAMHFHAGARGTCPTGAADSNDDGFVSVSEGHPFYGDIVTSLTTSGDTSPASGLAIDRFPTAPRGRITYHRTITVDPAAAAAIRAGNAVLVVHGVDKNGSGAYDGPVVSDLDPSLPMEATAPAGCGTVRALLRY
ncbi:hypothetical protein [Spirilliplanes yamanashiensis]|uniref:hypothetical protein n=1 Tax=Spirilliplanes yamanashiensis TaxID=42233 RepID=UPI001950426C|nr:hypothetical protein [Spirilliplanes yamanashiensis]MDP9814322.1 hypothetical protein [Spirilliplanes yamanashiensis]